MRGSAGGRSRIGLLIAVLAAAAAPLPAQAPSALPSSKIEAIEAAISAEMARQEIPGMSMAVVTDHQLRFTSGYGLSDLENFVPAKASTVYRLGSVSKPITAAAVMQLAESGRLDLDAPIQKYVPVFPEKPWPITSRQLLAHLGGVRHYAPGEFESTRHYGSLTEALDIFKNDPQLHEPGTRHLYTTYGYNLLGSVVEGASGMRFADYLRERIFRPAGMERTRADDVFEIIPNRAQGYRKAPGGALRNSGLADTSYKIPGGGLCATAADVARFAVALQTGVLLKRETVEQMFTKQTTRDGTPVAYGLGWGIDEFKGHKEVRHGGSQQRVRTLIYLQPDRRVTVVLMSNLEDAALLDLARRIADIALR